MSPLARIAARLYIRLISTSVTGWRSAGKASRRHPPPYGKSLLTDATVLNALIEPIVRDLGFDLVRVRMQGTATQRVLQVMAEDRATGQLTLAQCAQISRALDAPLDAADPVDGEYALEVSSPGIDRPLTRPGDWGKWTGHEVRMTLDPPVEDRKRLHGTIGPVSGDQVQIDVPTVGPVPVPFASIQSAKLVLTPKLIKASKPLDMTDAEDFDEAPLPHNDNDDIED